MYRCSVCQRELPSSEFYTLSDNARQYSCKSCQKQSVEAWREKNRERHNENARRWRAENRDKVRETNQQQYAKRTAGRPAPKPLLTPEEKRARKTEYSRRYRAANMEKVRATQAASKRRHRAARPDAERAYQREHYAKNRAKIRAQAKARYVTNAEKERAYSASYRSRNRERANAVVRDWRKKNPEKAKAVGQAWSKANPEAVHAMRKRRKALIRGATVNDLTAAQWASIQAAFDHRCAYCDKRCKGKMTQDHVTPLSKGGGHTASNIVPACKNCNSRKHTGPPLRPVQPRLLP